MRKQILILLLACISCKKENQSCQYRKLLDVNISVAPNGLSHIEVYFMVNDRIVFSDPIMADKTTSDYFRQYDITEWWGKELYINYKVFHRDNSFYRTEKKLIK